MPRRLLIIGALYCVFGAAAVLETVVQALRMSGTNVSLAVFLLPVGIGLLKARRSSRRWAVLWAVLFGALFFGALTLVTISGGDFSGTVLFGRHLAGTAATVAAWSIALGVIALCAFSVWGLYSPPVSAVFARTTVEMHREEQSEATPV